MFFFLIAKQVRYLHKHLSTCVKCQEILTIDTCLVDLTFSDRFLCLSVVKPVFNKANLFARTEKKAIY